MKLVLVYPRFETAKDGIADHTDYLSAALAEAGHDITILADASHRNASKPASPGVDLRWVGGRSASQYLKSVLRDIQTLRPDVAVLQFEQFAYGKYGFAPCLPAFARELQKLTPDAVVTIAHEDFTYPTSWKHALMSLYQRRQFYAVLHSSDIVCFSTDAWVDKYKAYVSAGRGLAVHLPVGSNLPVAAMSRFEAKRTLGIPTSAVTLGVFGGLAPHKEVCMISEAMTAAAATAANVQALYVGNDPDGFRDLASFPPNQTHIAAHASRDTASLHLAAVDIALSPFVDGVSTRRGSFLAHLQHGSATVTTLPTLLTGPLGEAASAEAFLGAGLDDVAGYVAQVLRLVSDVTLRSSVGDRGRSYYRRRHDWQVICSGLLDALDAGIGRGEST